MDFTPLVRARQALNLLWEKEADLKGRCWGPKRENNPYSASNITIAIGTELVSISQDPDGSLRIHEFSRTEGTLLGERIREILQREGLSFKE